MGVASTEGEENDTATISEFPGCGEVPGEVCYLEKDPGTCKEAFSVRWFYDVAYGGCSRDGQCQHARVPQETTLFLSPVTVNLKSQCACSDRQCTL